MNNPLEVLVPHKYLYYLAALDKIQSGIFYLMENQNELQIDGDKFLKMLEVVNIIGRMQEDEALRIEKLKKTAGS